MIFKSLQDNSKMVSMIILSLGIHKNIIYEYNDKYIKILLQYSIHEIH